MVTGRITWPSETRIRIRDAEDTRCKQAAALSFNRQEYITQYWAGRGDAGRKNDKGAVSVCQNHAGLSGKDALRFTSTTTGTLFTPHPPPPQPPD